MCRAGFRAEPEAEANRRPDLSAVRTSGNETDANNRVLVVGRPYAGGTCVIVLSKHLIVVWLPPASHQVVKYLQVQDPRQYLYMSDPKSDKMWAVRPSRLGDISDKKA